MENITNKRTGLIESIDEYYKLPRVHQASVGRLRFDGQTGAVHTVPLHGGLTLDFVSILRRSDELIVSLHGANMAERNFYPRFERVNSLRPKADALIAFADPTLGIDTENKMLLSWFLGGPGWDPSSAIVKVVRKAQGKTGSKHVAFLGGSGGGFAALRLSAMVPGSLAFVQDPQTNVGQYLPKVVSRYFSTVWPGWDGSNLIQAFPERFNMVDHYRESLPKNYIYYTQSRSDISHLEKHYNPFKDAVGIKAPSGISRFGTRKFVLYDGEVPGHGNMTPPEFDHHFSEAMAFWREHRK